MQCTTGCWPCINGTTATLLAPAPVCAPRRCSRTLLAPHTPSKSTGRRDVFRLQLLTPHPHSFQLTNPQPPTRTRPLTLSFSTNTTSPLESYPRTPETAMSPAASSLPA